MDFVTLFNGMTMKVTMSAKKMFFLLISIPVSQKILTILLLTISMLNISFNIISTSCKGQTISSVNSP